MKFDHFFLKYCIYTGGVQEGRRRGTGRVQERYRKGTGRVNYDKTQDTRHKTQDTSEPRKTRHFYKRNSETR